MSKDYKKMFVKKLNEIDASRNIYEVFRDFVNVAAIAINNSILKSAELENEYDKIIRNYDSKALETFQELLSYVVLDQEIRFSDFLGEVYMDIGISNSKNGQYFTPYHLSVMMAKLTGFNLTDDKEFVTLSEPSCGSGAMVIAYADVMLNEHKVNFQDKLWVQCADLDPLVAKMAYVQLSIIGVPGEVLIGNSLANEFHTVMRTPMHYIKGFDFKLAGLYSQKQTETTNDDKTESSKAIVNTADVATLDQQLALF